MVIFVFTKNSLHKRKRMTDSLKNFFSKSPRKTKKPTETEKAKLRKRKVEREQLDESTWSFSDSSITDKFGRLEVVSPNLTTRRDEGTISEYIEPSDDEISDEENELSDLGEVFGVDLEQEIKKVNRGRESMIHSRSNDYFTNEVNMEIGNRLETAKKLISLKIYDVNNNNNYNNSNVHTNDEQHRNSNVMSVEIFYSSDPTPRLIKEFESYSEIISADLSYKASIIGSDLLGLKTRGVVSPEFVLEECGPDYVKDFLRQPRGLFNGERNCSNESSCISCTLSSKTMSGVTKRESEFMIREFLLPQQKLHWEKTGCLPPETQMCILCNRLVTTVLYIKMLTNSREKSMEKYSIQYPHTFKFTKSDNPDEPPLFTIQDHFVPVCDSKALGLTRAYPIDSVLCINPAIGLTMPFKMFNPKYLHMTTFELYTNENSTTSCFGWEELDLNFQ